MFKGQNFVYLNTRFETIERITCHCFLRPLYQERPYEQLLHNWIFPTRRASFQIIFNPITQDTFCYKYHQCDYSHRGTWKRLSNNNDFWKTDQYIHKFESCLPRGQVSWNDFKVLNGCIIVFWIFLVRSPKKNNSRIFCFQKSLWLDNLLPSAPVRVVAL